MRTRHPVLLSLLGAGGLLVAMRAAAGIWAGHAWYAAMGALELWRLRAMSILLLTGLSGLAAAAFVFANLFVVRRSIVSLVLPRRVGNIEIGEEVPGRYLVASAAVLALMLGAVLAIPPDRWTTFAQARLGIPFGETDPRFQLDFGFWLYWLPFERLLHLRALLVVVVTVIVVTLLYALTPSLRVGRGGFYASHYVRRHWVVLGAILLLLLAWSYRLDAYGVMLNGTGTGGVVSAIDEHARIPVAVWLAVLTMGAALVALWFGLTGQLGVAVTAVVTTVVLSIGLRHLAPLVVERMSVQDAEQRDAPFVQSRAAYTRRAFGILDLPQLGPPPSHESATPHASLSLPTSVAAAASGIPLWDERALTHGVSLARSGSGIVRSVAWHAAPGGLQAVVLQALDVPSNPSDVPAWVSTRVDAGAGDAARGRTAADLSADLAEPSRTAPVLVLDSAGGPGYVIVADSSGHIVAPSLSRTTARVAFAWSLQNVRLLVRDLPRPDPRVVTRRSAVARVATLVPFLARSAPQSILVGDTIAWVIDLFATSETFPVAASVPFGGRTVTYLRHAGVALVNGATGSVLLVADEHLDPVARSWTGALPHLFVDRPRLPPRLARLLPPPAGEAAALASVVAHYGSAPGRPPDGHVPWDYGADSTVASAVAPPLALVTEKTLVDVRVVLSAQDSVVGVVAAAGGAHRRIVWVPFAAAAPRWAVVLDRLRRALDSAAVLPRDVRLVRGAVRVVPLDGGVAFVQPAYAWPATEPPSLAAVAVLTGDTVRAGATVLQAVHASAPITTVVEPQGPPGENFRARVSALYERMRDAMRRGDWVAFGHAYEALGTLLQQRP